MNRRAYENTESDQLSSNGVHCFIESSAFPKCLKVETMSNAPLNAVWLNWQREEEG